MVNQSAMVNAIAVVATKRRILSDEQMKMENCAARVRRRERYDKYKAIFGNEVDNAVAQAPLKWEDAHAFMSFEEYTMHREYYSEKLLSVYEHLLDQPQEEAVRVTQRADQSLKASNTNLKDNRKLRLIQLWEDELFDKYGGAEVVDKKLLPLGVLQALRAKKMTWNMNI